MRRSMALLGMLLLAAPATAENWPGWRGPRGDGTSSEAAAPLKWSATDNIAWKTPIPGKGHSSPVVWGDRVLLTTCVDRPGQPKTGDRVLLCLDRTTGKVLWERVVVTAPLEPIHKLNSFASSTPATDGKHIWVSFLAMPEYQIYCYDFDGNLVWKRVPGEFHSRHGFCSPPVLYKDLVILNGDQDAKAWIVALDQSTGEERWRADRPNRTRSYCPPVVVHAGGHDQLVLSGSKSVASYDPATGKQFWVMDGPTEQFVASLVYQDDILCLTAGFPTYHLMGIRPDGEIAWHHSKLPNREASYVPSPIAGGHWFYVVSDVGFLTGMETRSGKRLFTKRLGIHHSASPVRVGEYLYFPSDDGDTYILKVGPDFELVAKNPLGEEVYASPAVSGGQLFLRGEKHLFCIGAGERAE